MQLIEKHHIEITCSNQETAKHFQDEIAVLFEHKLYPQLENLLKVYDVSASVWIIEKINVKVPNLILSNWKQDLINSIVNQVEAYLKANTNKEKSVSKDKFYKQLLVHYLTNGVLPDNAVSDNLKKVLDEVNIDAEFYTLLKAEMDKNSNLYSGILSRLVLNTSYKLSEKLADELGALNSFKALNEILKRYTNEQNFLGRYLFWLDIFNKGLTDASKDETIKVAQTYFNINRKDIIAFSSALKPELSQKKELNSFLSELDALENHLDNKPIEDHKPNTPDKKDDIEAILEALEGSGNKLSSQPQNIYFINNVGLVIVTPFLVELFDKLDYLDNANQWKSSYFQNRAVLILQYLISGNTKQFENELILNKLVCGLGLKDTVCNEWEMTNTEKEQSQKLLESVIEHWSALKNTSVDTLRDSFLKRKAKLEVYKKKTNKIIVEQQGIDVLLDRLPWGISTLKTPWMEQYLSCEWT